MSQRRPYQDRIITQVGQIIQDGVISSIMIESPTGCLTGDTKIQVNLAGKSKSVTMREAYLHFHGGDPKATEGQCQCGCEETTKIPTKSDKSKGQMSGVPLKFINGHQSKTARWNCQVKVRVYKGQEGIGLHEIDNIVESGIKEVVHLVCANGMELTGTHCHPILTQRGWVPMSKLDNSDQIFIDNKTPQPTGQESIKIRDSHLWNAWNHPFGRHVLTKKENRGHSIRVPMHIAIYEAHINNLSFEEYTEIVRNGDPSNLQLVDPTVFVVHHKDKNHYNNSIDNLELLTIMEHNKLHGKEDWYKNFGNFEPSTTKMVSLVYAGKQMTYDICCKQPYHNFVANGIIVHNSGKTFMGLEIAQELCQIDTEVTVVWVAMRRFLLGQVVSEMQKHGINANIIPLSMFDLDGAKEIRRKLGDKPMLVILDEAHHDAAGSMTDLYQALEPDWIVGLSATPYRADKAKLCFEKQIRDAGIHRLIQEGWLSKFNMHMIDDWKVENVLRHYFMDVEKWGQSVFYFLTLAEAQECYRGLVTGGIACHFVQGSDKEETRIQQLKDFKEGKVKALVNCMVLTEGFDCPELETAWVRPSSRGPTMQMAGRVYRLCPGKIKRVVQSKDTRWPISRTAHPERQLVWSEDRWLDAQPNTRLAEIAIAAIKETITNYKPLPDYMTKRIKEAPTKRIERM